MAEPHQRVQSGKLRKSAKVASSNTDRSSAHKVQTVLPGIENAEILQTKESEDTLSYFMQTPTTLTDIHLSLLQDIAQKCNIKSYCSVNKDWRNTWNIGTWSINKEVSVSINLMQPNIAECWATVKCNKHEDLKNIVDKYALLPLEGSRCTAISSGGGYQIKGRWSLSAIDTMIHEGIIKKETVEIGSVNICQSRIFIWMLVGKESEYLCTLTQKSVELLVKYTPDWCSDLQEPTQAQNVTLRVKNPEKVNDASQLSINTNGWLQFNGRIDNASKLYGALSTMLCKTMVSVRLKPFLESLHYEIVPRDF